MISEKTIERLSLYRRFLNIFYDEKIENIYSHQLADMFGGSAAQVRRDFMSLGYNGKSRVGYKVKDLLDCLNDFFNTSEKVDIILVGIGNIGRSLITYFNTSNSHIHICAAFDKNDYKINRVISNCRSYHIDEAENFIKKNSIKTAIVSVPAIEAQNVSEKLQKAGIKSILNFSPVRLSLSKKTYVEDIDIGITLEKVIYFSGKNSIGVKNV